MQLLRQEKGFGTVEQAPRGVFQTAQGFKGEHLALGQIHQGLEVHAQIGGEIGQHPGIQAPGVEGVEGQGLLQGSDGAAIPVSLDLEHQGFLQGFRIGFPGKPLQ